MLGSTNTFTSIEKVKTDLGTEKELDLRELMEFLKIPKERIDKFDEFCDLLMNGANDFELKNKESPVFYKGEEDAYKAFTLKYEFPIGGIISERALINVADPVPYTIDIIAPIVLVNPFRKDGERLEYGMEISYNMNYEDFKQAFKMTPLMYSERTECIIFLEKEYCYGKLLKCSVMCVGNTGTFDDAVGFEVNYNELKKEGGKPYNNMLRMTGMIY